MASLRLQRDRLAREAERYAELVRTIDRTIARLRSYLAMADFGICATHWPLMDEWDRELAAGKMPGRE